MRARLSFLLAGLILASSIAIADTGAAPTQAKLNKSDEISLKIRQTDLLVHIVSVIYTKSQIDKILAKLEVFHARQAKIRKEEDQSLLLVDKELDKAISDALEKNIYPSRKTLEKVATLTQLLGSNRRAELNLELTEMLDLLKKELNAGQLKSIENSFAISALDPSKDDKKMSSNEKITFYIGRILLDEATYDLLVKMSKTAKD